KPPAASGGRRKPSFAYFPVDYLPDDVWRPDEPTDLREQNLPNATSYENSEDTHTNAPPESSGESLEPPRISEDGFLPYRLALATIFGR
ncbi:hypothetical protein THAOC_35196, partial [Thalassiosira oceanica]